MREATGYLADDGTFFEHAEDAERYEATFVLHGAYKQYVGEHANFVRFQNVITNLAPEIRRFLNAHEGPEHEASTLAEVEQAAIEREILSVRKPETPREHPSDDGLGGSFEAVVEQSDRGPLHMPDMGDSPRPKKVREYSPFDGVRSRGTDA